MGGDGVDFAEKDRNSFKTQMKKGKQNTVLQTQYKYTIYYR